MCDSVCDTRVTQRALSVGSLELRPGEEELCLLEWTLEWSLLKVPIKRRGQMASCYWLDLLQSSNRGGYCFPEHLIKKCFVSVNAEDVCVCVLISICFYFSSTDGEEGI